MPLAKDNADSFGSMLSISMNGTSNTLFEHNCFKDYFKRPPLERLI